MTLTWRNRTGNQVCHPRAINELGELEQIAELVAQAEREDTTFRAVGSGHAWSDVALTEGILAEPRGTGGGLLPLDDGCLKPTAAAGGPLVRVHGATRLRELNEALWDKGLALRNMGGYDAQRIAGVVATSTHGSGIGLGPFPDVVRSLDLVVERARLVRIEPDDGPTDRARFEAADDGRRELLQDDGVFAAAVCGIGCMGVVHSLVLRVREQFWLREVRTISTWEAVRKDLGEDGVLSEHDHYELFVNPYVGKDGEHLLLVTTRTPCEEPGAGLPQHKRERHPLTELQAGFPLTWVLIRLAARYFPSLVAKRFDRVIFGMRDEYRDRSYRVFNIGEANKIPAYSSELAVSLENGRHVAAMDRVLEIAARRREQDGMYHTSPIALRFTAPSKAYASMMYDRPTMMIELIMAKGTRDGYELLKAYERELADLEVRPHWGQCNWLDGDSDLRALYPMWDDWLKVYAGLNASGVFDSPFTQRIGISRRPQPSDEPEVEDDVEQPVDDHNRPDRAGQ